MGTGVKNITLELDKTEESRDCFRREVESVWLEFYSGKKEGLASSSVSKNKIPQSVTCGSSTTEKLDIDSLFPSDTKIEHCSRKQKVDCTGSGVNDGQGNRECDWSSEIKVLEESSDRDQEQRTDSSDRGSGGKEQCRDTSSKWYADGRSTVSSQSDRAGICIEPRVCMIGLHCCGDLTPTMMEFFIELECVKVLCCVSCCFHRMELQGK